MEFIWWWLFALSLLNLECPMELYVRRTILNRLTSRTSTLCWTRSRGSGYLGIPGIEFTAIVKTRFTQAVNGSVLNLGMRTWWYAYTLCLWRHSFDAKSTFRSQIGRSSEYIYRFRILSLQKDSKSSIPKISIAVISLPRQLRTRTE